MKQPSCRLRPLSWVPCPLQDSLARDGTWNSLCLMMVLCTPLCEHESHHALCQVSNQLLSHRHRRSLQRHREKIPCSSEAWHSTFETRTHQVDTVVSRGELQQEISISQNLFSNTAEALLRARPPSRTVTSWAQTRTLVNAPQVLPTALRSFGCMALPRNNCQWKPLLAVIFVKAVAP